VNRLRTNDGQFIDPNTGELTSSVEAVILSEGLLSRNYYSSDGDLTCWSSDSNTPDDNVLAANKQSSRCIDCIQNIKGATGFRTKPCKFYTTISLVEENSLTACSLRIGGASLFAKSINKMTLYQYRDYLKSNKEQLHTVLTEIYLSQVKDLFRIYFKPVRPLTQEELTNIQQLNEAAELNPFKEQYMTYVIKNVIADWPRINQPYKWSDEQNRSVPCASDAPGASYELGFLMDLDQAKELYGLMKTAWDEKRKTDKAYAKYDDLKMTFKKQDGGTYKGTSRIKAAYESGPTDVPDQYDIKNNKLDKDFELTHKSLVHIQVEFVPYKKTQNSPGGISLRLKAVMVKKLAPKVSRESPFEAEEDGFVAGDSSDSPFTAEDTNDGFESNVVPIQSAPEPDPFADEEPAAEPVKREKKKEEPKASGEDHSSIIDEWGSEED